MSLYVFCVKNPSQAATIGELAMAMPTTLPDWVITEMAKQMASVGATGWDEGTQMRFLRLLLEQGLDELEARDNEYYDFMADCAMLASEVIAHPQGGTVNLLKKR